MLFTMTTINENRDPTQQSIFLKNVALITENSMYA